MSSNDKFSKSKRYRCLNRPKNFICSNCSKKYQTQNSLNNHQRKIHDKINDFLVNKNTQKKEGRPKTKKELINFEKISIEENIYQTSLEMIYEFHINEKENIFLDISDPFFNVKELLDKLEKNFKAILSNSLTNSFFEEMKRMVFFTLNPENQILNFDPNEDSLKIKLKKLAFSIVKFADFLNETFFEFFLVLNLEIINSFYENNFTKIDWISRKVTKSLFFEEKISIFSKNYLKHIKQFLTN